MLEASQRLVASVCSESGGVDHEAVLHVRLHHAIVRLIDLITADDFVRAGDFVLGAEVQHLLCLTDSTDHRACDRLALWDEAEGMEAQWLRRHAHHDKFPVLLQESQVGRDVVVSRDGVNDEVQGAGSCVHFLLLGHHHKLVGLQLLHRLVALALAARQDGDLTAPSLPDENSHGTKATKASHAQLHAGLEAVVSHGRVDGHAGAKQRRGACQVQGVGDPADVILVHHNALGVAAIGWLAPILRVLLTVLVLVLAVVGHDGASVAVVLIAILAALAAPAAVDHAAHAHLVAHLIFGDALAHGRHNTTNLVAWHHWEDATAPFLPCLMHVRVANAGELDVDGHIVGTRSSPFNGVWHKRASRDQGCIALASCACLCAGIT
mmetsp:Transcript_37019/g.69031  ORF Transcript_37019/g.69031 Transcript_37019/m.69031 type:complete len:379 (+) Transcript_37019:57-1193(+)